MSKDINIELGDKAIDNAIKELKKYKLKLIRRNRSIVYHLMEAGWHSVQSTMATAVSDDANKRVKKTYDLPSTNFRGSVVEGNFIITNEDIMFWEFGAGIHYNTSVGTSPHPKSGEYGGKIGVDTTIGSYRDIGNGYSLGQYDSWYFDGQKTHGTEAAMPMYNAWRHMNSKAVQIITEMMKEGNLYG